MEKRGELSEIVSGQRSSQYDVLIATTPYLTVLAKKLCQANSDNLIVLPHESINSVMVPRDSDDLSKAQETISRDQYKIVVTDRKKIADMAATRKFPVIFIDRDNQGSGSYNGPYHLDSTKKGFVHKFRLTVDQILSSYYTKKVLIAEDDPSDLASCKKKFEDGGYEVITAADEEGAVSIIREGGLSAVVTSLGFLYNPMGGLHLLQKNDSKIPVIIHVGYDSERVLSSLEGLDVYGIVKKSSDSPEKLVDLVTEALGLQQPPTGAGQSMSPFADGTERQIVERLKKLRKERKPTSKFAVEFERAQAQEATKSGEYHI